MSRTVFTAVFLLAMVGLIVGLDVAFFRNHAWLRLLLNVGIVLAFISLYFRFVKRS